MSYPKNTATITVAPTELSRPTDDSLRRLAAELEWANSPVVTVSFDADNDRAAVRIVNAPTTAEILTSQPVFIGLDATDKTAAPTVITVLDPTILSGNSQPELTEHLAQIIGPAGWAVLTELARASESRTVDVELDRPQRDALIAAWRSLLASAERPGTADDLDDDDIERVVRRWSEEILGGAVLTRAPGTELAGPVVEKFTVDDEDLYLYLTGRHRGTRSWPTARVTTTPQGDNLLISITLTLPHTDAPPPPVAAHICIGDTCWSTDLEREPEQDNGFSQMLTGYRLIPRAHVDDREGKPIELSFGTPERSSAETGPE